MEFAEVLYRLLDYSDKNFLLKLKLINKNINQEFIESFIKLDDIAKKFYKNKWFDNINYYNSYIIKSKLIAEKLLVIMNEEKIEPLEYLNNNMNC
ncbi:hypothetical protein AB4865_06645 [Capnocytophaga sp. ARDL2]|uniref:hypothetical protein n=1 Tax=Capnocytophaga sp. ARDL2 TaxID=3238809 RepID=UPI0035560D59